MQIKIFYKKSVKSTDVASFMHTAYTHSCKHIYIYIYILTHAHTHARAHTHTYTFLDSSISIQLMFFSCYSIFSVILYLGKFICYTWDRVPWHRFRELQRKKERKKERNLDQLTYLKSLFVLNVIHNF